MLNSFESGITSGDKTSLMISVDAWKNGQRPGGYQETSGAIREAHSLNIHLRELLSPEELSRWNELVRKARISNLDRKETEEIIALSVRINQVVRNAVDSRIN